MIKDQKIFDEWNKIDSYTVSFLNENFNRIASALLVYLISSVLEETEFEIGTFEDGRQKGASISYMSPNKNKQIELRVKRSSSYELLLYVYHSEEEISIFKNKLEEDEIKMIPQSLRDLLDKVKTIGQPVSFYTSQIA